MKRRNFLKNVGLAAGAQIMLNGIALKAMSAQPKLAQTARLSTNGRVLVLLQLHGGNDGLNTVIPVSQYDQYYNMRPNLAIPDSGKRSYITLDSTLPDNQQLGLHPDMTGMKDLYDSGRMTILQNVGYEHVNGSHFKSRDIWFGGGGYADDVSGGWIGRYLELEYARSKGLNWPLDFPNTDMPDPLGLEFSNEVSLGFHTEDTVPAGLSIPSPGSFFDLVQELPGYNEEINVDPRGFPADLMKDSLYGEELEWILNIEKDTDKYADRLQKAYIAGGKSRVEYPSVYPLAAPEESLKNPISANLQIISRLIAGGCQSRVYLIRVGGFDTHVNQVTPYDNTMGKHAALLHHLSAAMKAFQDDLRDRGLEDKVLSVSISEFGRRALANNSYGSDHGTVAPMFVFGSKLNPGVLGQNPDLGKVAQNGGNLADGKDDIIDYRTVFNTILQEWFEVSPDKIPQILPSMLSQSADNALDVHDTQPLFSRNVTAIHDFVAKRFRLNDCYPNPVQHYTTFSFHINSPVQVKLGLYNLQGQLVKELMNKACAPGPHELRTDLSGVPAGVYLYRIDGGRLQDAKRLVKVGG